MRFGGIVQGQPSSFWGKLERDQDGAATSWHPLVDHCADVAACLQALLEEPTIRRRLARVGGLDDLEPQQIQRLCVFAALHDVGKVNTGFQNKAFLGRVPLSGHVAELAALLGSCSATTRDLLCAIRWGEIEKWSGAAPGTVALLAAAVGHHGSPCALDGAANESLWKSGPWGCPIDGAAEVVAGACCWFPDAFAAGGSPLPSEPAFAHAFLGLLTLADWLGSTRRFFPFSQSGGRSRFNDGRGFAAAAVKAVGLGAAALRAGWRKPALPFAGVFGFSLRSAQQAVVQAPVCRDGGLDILESETGSGKTEAAVGRFLRLFGEGKVDGLYFALPTRTAATQIYKRVCTAVERAFPTPASRPTTVLAVPGYIDMQQPQQNALAPDGAGDVTAEEGPALACQWAAEHPKKFLAGTVVVGTIDQVLLSALTVRHAHLRAACLLRHLLVVDEVHASDAYMNRLLREVLARHVGAGGYALLMSATLGVAAREMLAGADPRTPARKLPSEQDAIVAPYPSLTSRAANGETRPRRLHGTTSSKRVLFDDGPGPADHHAIAERALDCARRGAGVLVIRNTVTDCVATQIALEQLAGPGDKNLLLRCKDVPAPHHSRFARRDRTALDDALELALGKGRDGGLVVVATQTVQQSLDLDADFMITDLCPMDVLLQRVGRVHRGQRQRPPGFEVARVLVMTPNDGDLDGCIKENGEAQGRHGLGSVYPDLRILEATKLALKTHSDVCIPAMNRQLVERATHPEALQRIVAGRGLRWQRHAQSVDGQTAAQRTVAGMNVMRWDVALGDPNDRRYLFPGGNLDRRIAARLGTGDCAVFFETALRGPFGHDVPSLTVPAHLSRDIDRDAVPSAVQRADGFTFVWGGTEFIYDRFGLRPA